MQGHTKLLASNEDKKILGCQILGSHASVLIHEELVRIKLDRSIWNIARTLCIHSALSEVV
jgi:pyruvate/2-oxoglutarate dehydrogenase complex dihydrolipoamide dehydrogenase (E3) component